MSWSGRPLADLNAVLTKLPLILIAPMYACPLTAYPPKLPTDVVRVHVGLSPVLIHCMSDAVVVLTHPSDPACSHNRVIQGGLLCPEDLTCRWGFQRSTYHRVRGISHSSSSCLIKEWFSCSNRGRFNPQSTALAWKKAVEVSFASLSQDLTADRIVQSSHFKYLADDSVRVSWWSSLGNRWQLAVYGLCGSFSEALEMLLSPCFSVSAMVAFVLCGEMLTPKYL